MIVLPKACWNLVEFYKRIRMCWINWYYGPDESYPRTLVHSPTMGWVVIVDHKYERPHCWHLEKTLEQKIEEYIQELRRDGELISDEEAKSNSCFVRNYLEVAAQCAAQERHVATNQSPGGKHELA